MPIAGLQDRTDGGCRQSLMRARLSKKRREHIMAVYSCITQEGTLSAEQRARFAEEITRGHIELSGDNDPARFIRVIFQTVPPDSTFVGGKAAANIMIVGIVRQGRSAESKATLLKGLWSMCKNATRLSGDQIWVSVTEIPPTNGMEYGAVLPEPGHEAEWLTNLGLPVK
jgi:phenylpyruvate tautomerase PptA (4-oxalocrotonate tautomerase family)